MTKSKKHKASEADPLQEEVNPHLLRAAMEVDSEKVRRREEEAGIKRPAKKRKKKAD
jgi:hypothetical protein